MTWTSADIIQHPDGTITKRRADGLPKTRNVQDMSHVQHIEIVDSGPHQDVKTTKVYLPVTPMPAPRMVRGDTALAKKADYEIPRRKLGRIRQVRRYLAFKQSILEAWPAGVPYPTDGYHMVFYIPIPKSRKRGKGALVPGMPHRQTPDKDNMEKAVLDALYENDSHVWDGRTTKLWSEHGYIEIYLDALPSIQTIKQAA